MTRSFSLSMGALADDIEVQLRHQGLTLGSRSDAERIQRWANEISNLGIHGLLTAALRAVADRVAPERPIAPHGTGFRWGGWAAEQGIRGDILSIAAELEAHP